jgi:metallo-beta-lactamase family protein
MTTNDAKHNHSPRVTFLGAAQSVTGSMHLVEGFGRRVLLDCGSARGRRDEPRVRDGRFPFPPESLDAVVLSHAHIDHCGNLPNLVRQGYRGPVYCTPATRDLVNVMLADSARFQEEDARLLRILGRADESGSLTTRDDARGVVGRCVAVPYGERREILPGVGLRFADAGHILGSAMVSLTLSGPGRDYTITFTGDVGRRGLPFLHEPEAVPEADLIICESTYGGRKHEPLASMAETMAGVLRRAREEGGRVLIPAFSLGRTQVVVHYLHRWMRSGRVPSLPIFVDSPTAADVADVCRLYPESFVDEGVYPFDDASGGTDRVHHLRSREESQEVRARRGPCVIVASSGMCDAGRILQHLKEHIDDPRCSVVLVSYQAPQTLGRRLLEPVPKVRIHGRDWNLWARVLKVDGFSGHADQDDLVHFLGPQAGRAKKVRLVHGEPEQADQLADALRDAGFGDVAVPGHGEAVNVA